MKASDLPEQSIQIGKFQQVAKGSNAANCFEGDRALLEGRYSGRIARNDITISTAPALLSQDLYIGQFVLSMSEVAQHH